MNCAKRTEFRVQPYNLAATLNSGQAFRWYEVAGAYEGVVGGRWLRLTSTPEGIAVAAAETASDWTWLAEYLRVDEDLSAVVSTFPPDEPLQAATRTWSGLRLLRQDPWECLASFILSPTKQIAQIRQMVRLICERYGDPVVVPVGRAPEFSFPTPGRLARCTEAELLECKMGFRAARLREAARRVAAGQIDLDTVHCLPLEAARDTLMTLAGVGPKVADCVLLFAYGFPAAFPLDTWVQQALRKLYFPNQRVGLAALRRFSREHFGPHAGYAQQYLFHDIRSRATTRGGEDGGTDLPPTRPEPEPDGPAGLPIQHV